VDWLALLVGLGLLLGGGEILVRGATALARSLGISPLVIGLTVVAFGTSAPELAVNITATLRGQGSISFGNIVGSNIANIGLVLGIAALVRPLKVQPSVVTREIPIMLGATLLAVLLASDQLLGGAAGLVSRLDGLVLLAGFAVFLYLTVRSALRDRTDSFLDVATEEGKRLGPERVAQSVALTLGGLVGVVLGGQWTVTGAVGIATALGVSETIIGLTIVAIGTSLPELAASLIAVRHGQADLAVGNVVGSNVFNLLLVLGPTAMIRPIPVPAGGQGDLLVLVAVSLVLLPVTLTGQRIIRLEGAALLVGYWAYMLWRTFG